MTLSLPLDRLLEPVGALGDLLLRESALDRRDHAAHAVDLLEVGQRALFHLAGQSLDEVGAAERIGLGGDAAFVGDHLLRAQRERRPPPRSAGASASSSELVCSELVPPSTPDSACSAVRTTLL